MHDFNRAKLKLVNQYIISFTGLKEGEHEFTFDFDKKFFDEHEVLEAQNGRLNAVVLLNKKPSMLSLDISLKGQIEIQCDKCLDYFNYPIHYQGELIVKFSSDTNAGNDEIWVLDPAAHELDLKQYFFECIGLCIPIQRSHPEDENGEPTCDPEMLNLLDSYSTSEKEEEQDPRWNELKKFLNDNNN